MRMKLTMQIFKEITQKINFFKAKPEEFIAQVGPQILKRTYS